MDIQFFLNSALLGVGLAMDAFSVSLANGLTEPNMGPRRMSAISSIYAGFQFAMPLLGWFCVTRIVSVFHAFEPLIPWIALGLLLYIGGKMLAEGIRNRNREESAVSVLTLPALLVQGIATSIDALSVGFSTASYRASAAILSSLVIGGVTFVICLTGLAAGKKFGTRLAGKASILGGSILIAIGIEIFVRGMLS